MHDLIRQLRNLTETLCRSAGLVIVALLVALQAAPLPAQANRTDAHQESSETDTSSRIETLFARRHVSSERQVVRSFLSWRVPPTLFSQVDFALTEATGPRADQRLFGCEHSLRNGIGSALII